MIVSVTLAMLALQAAGDVRLAAAAHGMNPLALQRLIDRCKESHSAGLVILADGQTVISRNFGTSQPASNLMSATKSFTSIAIGMLMDEGKIASVDTPVQTWFPEYKGKWKDKVTLRHLLEHTSGIEAHSSKDSEESLNHRIKSALAAPIDTEPGAVFFYNNRAADLIAGIVAKAAGEQMDTYLNRKLFRPLGFQDGYFWMRDEDGVPHGSAELVISPRDMAKVGQLMLNRGIWKGQRLLSERYIDAATQPSRITMGEGDECGWLWWMAFPWFTLDEGSLTKLKDAKVPPAMIAKIRPLIGKEWPGMPYCMADMQHAVGDGKAGLDLAIALAKAEYSMQTIVANRFQQADHVGYFAAGWGGQYIFVLPKEKIVAVRTCGTGNWEGNESAYTMGDFFRLVRDLRKPPSR